MAEGNPENIKVKVIPGGMVEEALQLGGQITYISEENGTKEVPVFGGSLGIPVEIPGVKPMTKK